MKLELNAYYLTGHGEVVQIIEYQENTAFMWPYTGQFINGEEGLSTYSAEGITSVGLQKSIDDLVEKITKEKNPEYFL